MVMRLRAVSTLTMMVVRMPMVTVSLLRTGPMVLTVTGLVVMVIRMLRLVGMRLMVMVLRRILPRSR